MRYLSLCSSLAALALVPLCACESLTDLTQLGESLLATSEDSPDDAAPARNLAEQTPARAEQASAPRSAAPPLKPLAERVKTTKSGEVYTTLLRDFDAVKREQEEPVWCWAACTQMILAFNGIESSQDDIATRIHGSTPTGTKVEAASLHEIRCALNPDMDPLPYATLMSALEEAILNDPEDLDEIDIKIDGSMAGSAALSQFAPVKEVAVEDLRDGHPAVVGLRGTEVGDMGHAYVLIGAKYTENLDANKGSSALSGLGSLFGDEDSPLNDPLVRDLVDRADGDPYPATEVTLVDPLTGKVVTFTGTEFSERVKFVMSRRHARETLEKLQAIATVK